MPIRLFRTYVHFLYLTVSTTSPYLAQTMLTMLADPALSDVYLVVGDIDIPAHKSVLGKRYESVQGKSRICSALQFFVD